MDRRAGTLATRHRICPKSGHGGFDCPLHCGFSGNRGTGMSPKGMRKELLFYQGHQLPGSQCWRETSPCPQRQRLIRERWSRNDVSCPPGEFPAIKQRGLLVQKWTITVRPWSGPTAHPRRLPFALAMSPPGSGIIQSPGGLPLLPPGLTGLSQIPPPKLHSHSRAAVATVGCESLMGSRSWDW